MALTPKEREKIIEEEQLRFETRQTLAREHCAKHRPNRWLWRLAFLALIAAVVCHFACGGGRACAWAPHPGCMHEGYGYGVPDKDAGAEPGQPLAPKK